MHVKRLRLPFLLVSLMIACPSFAGLMKELKACGRQAVSRLKEKREPVKEATRHRDEC